MKKIAFLSTILTVALALVLSFFGSSQPGPVAPRVADLGAAMQPLVSAQAPAGLAVTAAPRIAIAASTRLAETTAVLSSAAAATCVKTATGTLGSAPGTKSAGGVAGTTSADLASFATKYNAIRIANCLTPIPYGNIRYDSCMEARLFWMAESPSPDPMDAWGHVGSKRIDGVPSTGCDGNLAGGSSNTGATVAQKWWNSTSHRASLYRPGSSIAGACINFAMTHGGIDEPVSFVRAAARWTTC